ncbi:DUF805 domain-containing protein [Vibrio sp. JC009]|uniref:DUF805 domain-containing protein n=1 Tax=Vibrio sp. JC009 TaxID=2912314 RepID=UPI0023B15903|nr:DUF805 domain-containing protein [Vibrio sp. JC009]WED21658.1 DUF805 domain-containing protein [Vibrio sp. JC009]
MSLAELLFSFNGRIGRRKFWLWNASYYLIILAVASIVGKLMPELAKYVFTVLLIVLIIPDLAVTAKRWHDRNKSNKWLLLNIPLILGRMMFPAAGAVAEASPLQAGISLSALVAGAWILVECGFLKGDPTDNDYGQPDV